MAEPQGQPQPEPRRDSRQAPRWGEYADTPPPPPVPTPAATEPAADAGLSQGPPVRRLGDMFLTALLLGVGLLDVVLRFPQFENFAEILHEAYAQLGYGEFTSDAAANAMGAFQNLGRVVLLIAAVGLSARLISRGKRAFWVPLAAGVAAAILLTVGFFVVILGDPALAQYAQTL